MKKEVIYYRESALQSIISDVGTFGVLMLAFWVNYRFIGASKAVFVVIIFLWFFALYAKAQAKKVTFVDKEKLLKHINETL